MLKKDFHSALHSRGLITVVIFFFKKHLLLKSTVSMDLQQSRRAWGGEAGFTGMTQSGFITVPVMCGCKQGEAESDPAWKHAQCVILLNDASKGRAMKNEIFSL